MRIDQFFISYQLPGQWLYSGEDHLGLFARRGGAWALQRVWENCSLPGLNDADFFEIRRDFSDLPVGLVMNPAAFVFNFFDFDKLPFPESQRREIIEWRLHKVFPENLGDFTHQYYLLNKKKVLSVLLKTAILEKVESLFARSGLKLTYLTNSTMEIMNKLLRASGPDFFLELDRSWMTMAFQKKGVPIYLRKFHGPGEQAISDEVTKTMQFVRNNYALEAATFALVPLSTHWDIARLTGMMLEQNLREIRIARGESLIFPGKP